MEVKMWFSFEVTEYKSHAKNEEFVNIIVYLNKTKNHKKIWLENSNWRLLLTNSHCWIWKTDKQELIETGIEDIRLLLKTNPIKFKYFSSIITKYMKNPCSLDEIMEELSFSSPENKKKTNNILLSSGEKEFYLTSWIQNGLY
ncbi:hypothetical protein [Fusobacterium sp. THCT1E2]